MNFFRLFSFTFLLFLFAFESHAQTSSVRIRIWEVKGNVKISVAKGSSIPLTKKQILAKGQKIVLGDSASLLLVNEEGMYAEIVKPGVYSTDSLLSELSVGNKDLLLQQYKRKLAIPDTFLQNNSQNCIHFLGRVMRCPQYMSFIGPTFKCKLYDSTVFVHWYNRTTGIDPPYILFVNNMFQERILTIPTNLHWAWVKLPFSGQDHQLILSVYSEARPNEQCDPVMVSLCDSSVSDVVSQKLKQLTQPETGFSEILKAFVFEEQLLYLDAMKAYQEAVHRAPDSDYYKTLYAIFLIRNNFARVDRENCHPYCVEY